MWHRDPTGIGTDHLRVDDTPEIALAREQAEILHNSMPTAVAGTVVAMSVTAVLLRRHEPWPAILAWLGLALPIHGLRFALWWKLRDRRQLLTRPRESLRLLQWSALAAGLSWAPLSIWLFAPDDLFRMFLTALLVTVAGAAVAALAPIPAGALAYTLPILVPLVIRLLASATPLLQVAGWLALLYIGFVALVSRRMEALLREKSSLRAQAVRSSLTDSLTGIANRLCFERQLASALSRARRRGGEVALFYIDLDDFKRINDQYGHTAGDRVLHGFAQRLASTLRADEYCARLGGDEFVAAVERWDARGKPGNFDAIAARIGDAIRAPFDLGDGTSVMMSASIGMACFPADGADLGALLKSADARMYAAKPRVASDQANPTQGSEDPARVDFARAPAHPAAEAE